MTLPFVIDNDRHRMADVLNRLLAVSRGRAVDIATAYFSISGFRIVQPGLQRLGAFRLLLGAEPHSGSEIGLRPDEGRMLTRLAEDVAAEPFTASTLRLVEDLIAFLRSGKVQVRLFQGGFLHAKAYIFHQDAITPANLGDRLRPYAAIVGSSNFTAPGLTSNRELNVVHRVFTPADEARDAEAEQRAAYLLDAPPQHGAPPDDEAQEALEAIDEAPAAGLARTAASGAGPLAPAGDGDLSDAGPLARRLIKSEVGARAITDLTEWYERHWAESKDFKEALIELLDASKFGSKEYTPYQVYLKALYEYFADELGEEALGAGRSAVALAEFQEDAVKKARRVLSRYDGVLIADSVGLGKTWIGKKLLEDFAYHKRQKALVVCAAGLREMWEKELASATIAAQIVGMEELGRDSFNPRAYGDVDVILVDESHNFRGGQTNRYLALEQVVQLNGGRGRDGERKKVILLSATPINNDLYDLLNQLKLFTQTEPDYFRDIGIGDLDQYFRRARSQVRGGAAAGTVLFNLLEEIIVRNTRPFIRAAYPNATIAGKPVRFPERRLKTIRYSLGETYAGFYGDIVRAVSQLSLAPYQLESYRKQEAIRDKNEHEWEQGREQGFVGIYRTRLLKRLESSVEAFRLSLSRALTFEATYLDYLLDRRVVSSRDFQKAMRYLEQDAEDELGPGSAAEALDANAEAKAYIESLPTVSLNDYDLRKLRNDVEADVKLLRELYDRTEPLVARDAKIESLKHLLAGELRGRKVLIFSTFKDTSRYVHRCLTDDAEWRTAADDPAIRRIDSGNHPSERGQILGHFAPVANDLQPRPTPDQEIDILISTDVLSEGQNLQDCGVIINFDLTWNPIRLVQRNGRIDRIGSPHEQITICNMFPEDELEQLLGLVQRLTDRISRIDELGLLDASVLGEVVHPRTFNTLRRIQAEDGSVLDEEEERAELAGPETLLKQLKELLNREGADLLKGLPHGIHSGLRRDRAHGMFFYFQAPHGKGVGKRHFWRYIDANTREVLDNRFQIAGLIACQLDEPRYIGDLDVFELQELVIDSILRSDADATARAVAPKSVDPSQLVVAEEIKNAIRRGTVERDAAKAALQYLGKPLARFAIKRLKTAHAAWQTGRNDPELVQAVLRLAADFSKDRDRSDRPPSLLREHLELVCFEYVTG